jgi:pimeloyl-ACP methyl ester carboxylesterase
MPTTRVSTGIDLYYETHGQGEPVVFIPSTSYSGDVWLDSQVPTLSRSLQVIVFDPRGSGRSSSPEGVYTIEQMACDTVALLDVLGLPAAHVVGHSMGGRIGLQMALDFPGRVKSLVMAASGSGAAARPGDECVPGLPYRLVHDLVQMGFEEYVRHEVMETDTFFTGAWRAEHPAELKAFYDLAWRTHSPFHTFLRLVMARHMWDATHRLGSVQVPTLVLVGDADVVGSNHIHQARTLVERIPGAEHQVLAGQSHGFFWQAPEETNRVLLEWVQHHAG